MKRVIPLLHHHQRGALSSAKSLSQVVVDQIIQRVENYANCGRQMGVSSRSPMFNGGPKPIGWLRFFAGPALYFIFPYDKSEFSTDLTVSEQNHARALKIR